ncbi:endonuclease/exonuclease/phosphatase family protein [Caulifigura coniformis]|nr:endonuclease/exonuclease/phosphatase family protein [Caulifigura coniformis]
MPNESAATRRSWWRRIPGIAGKCAVALFVLGLAVRLTVRDRWVVANTLYYATPWSILFVLGCLSAVWLRRRRAARPLAWVTGLVAVACAGIWFSTSWRTGPSARGAGDVRAMTWNLAHGRWGLEGLAKAAAMHEPDIALFVEADPSRIDVRAIFKSAFPEHHVFLLGGGIVLVSRWPGGDARAYQFGSEKTESRIREIDLATPWGTWTVFGCDMASNTLYQREPHFRELAERIAGCPHPVICTGDFNTPLDSLHVEKLRAGGLTEAFEAAGEGYLPTWPVPAPVLSLDQMWISKGLKPVGCVRRWNWRSDHAAVITEIGIEPAP